MNVKKENCELDLTLFIRSIEEEAQIAINCTPESDENVIHTKNIEGELFIEKTNRELFAEFDIEAHPEFTCDRCTTSFAKHMHISFKRLYTDKPSTDDVDEKKIPRNFKINIGDEVNEEIITQGDFQKLCKRSCKGLCNECGKDLNKHPDHAHNS